MKALLVLFLFSFSFSSFGLEVMSYNVENLFDTKHDSNKNDWQYLPTTFKGKKENCSKISYKRYRD